MQRLTNAEVGAAIKARRLQLGMAELAFVTAAGIDAKTLQRLEDGTRWPWESTRLKIEQALKWSPGDIEKLRAGGEPTPLPDAEPQPSTETPPARPSIFEEAAIAGFPDVFRGLPKSEQLQVIDFTGQLQTQRQQDSAAPLVRSSSRNVVELRGDPDEDGLADAIKAHGERQ